MIPGPVPLIQAPTPCHRLPHLSDELGVDLWIKRDDLTGFAFGGNKGRKLEYLMAEALSQRADVVVTCGAAQSNFVRQLGAACSMVGMACEAAVMNLPYAAIHGRPSGAGAHRGGNLTLDELVGVQLHTYPDDDWEVLYAHAEDLAQAREARGETVYRIPIGGSSPFGAYAFVKAAKELTEPFQTIVVPSSSGSTQAGLAYAFHKSATRIVGIACDPEPEIMEDLLRLVAGLDDLIGDAKQMTSSDLDLRLDWAGEAYGISSPAGEAAIRELAQKEGIFLDPIYSAKAFSGLLDLCRRGELTGRVLFWHTGGLPALFAE